MNESRQMIKNCIELTFDTLNSDVLDRVKYFLLDYLGVAARGSRTESSLALQHTAQALRLNQAGQSSRIIGTSFRADPGTAALLNGTAAHSLELDDVVNAASLHPGVAIMPAVLAAAEYSDSSAADLFEAIVTGYEVMIRLGIALNPAAHYQQGFHPTGTCGAFGAAVAAGKMLHLNEDQLANAFGIAGSQASGSLEFLADGAYTKRLHPGWAAHAGVMAAFMAQAGLTGPKTILEGKHGFLRAYSPVADANLLLKDWAEPYALMRTSIKPHACCRYKQGPIDGVLKIMKDHQLREDDVAAVTTDILSAGYALVAEPLEEKQHPQQVVDAQFSMPFGAAVAIHFGKAGLDQYQQEIIQLPAIQELMKRVTCAKNPAIDKEFPNKWTAFVKLETKQGETYSTWIDYPKGDPENPLSWNELIEKFHDLTAPVYEARTRERIVATVRALEAQDSIDVLMEALKSSPQKCESRPC